MSAVVVLRLYLFGALRIEANAQRVRLSTHKLEALLAYLVLHPHTAHTREKLATLCWGDATDAQARASLRNALPVLRRTLGADALMVDRETVQFNPTANVWVDALTFQAQAAAFLTAALPDPHSVQPELYQGDLLSEFTDEWIEPEREAYRQLYLKTLLRLLQQWQAHNDYQRAIASAQRMLACDPTHEPAHQSLMRCYQAMGDQRAALQQYETCQRVLRAELAVEPSPETTALYRQIKRTSASRPVLDVPLTNLPHPLTSFIGRASELAALQAWLREPTTRLTTLIGPGGSGKTRLAIQVAAILSTAGDFADGVWWVELATLMDAAFVPAQVARTWGLREQPAQTLLQTLTNHLRAKQLLLVLDNCEHLIVACAQLVEQLLLTCPRLQVLATSREALGLMGERVWPLSPLSLSAPVSLRSDAAQLFIARAMAVQLGESDAALIAHFAT